MDDPIRTLRYEDLKTIREPLKKPPQPTSTPFSKNHRRRADASFYTAAKNMEELWHQLGIVKITRQGAEDI